MRAVIWDKKKAENILIMSMGEYFDGDDMQLVDNIIETIIEDLDKNLKDIVDSSSG